MTSCSATVVEVCLLHADEDFFLRGLRGLEGDGVVGVEVSRMVGTGAGCTGSCSDVVDGCRRCTIEGGATVGELQVGGGRLSTAACWGDGKGGGAGGGACW